MAGGSTRRAARAALLARHYRDTPLWRDLAAAALACGIVVVVVLALGRLWFGAAGPLLSVTLGVLPGVLISRRLQGRWYFRKGRADPGRTAHGDQGVRGGS